MASILIIDDDEITLTMFSRVINRMGHQISCASTLKDGIRMSLSEEFDIVLLDIRLPDGNGLEALPVIQKAPSLPEIIIFTGYGSLDGAEIAIKNGAWDYIEKGSSIERTTLTLTRALQYRNEKKKISAPVIVLEREGIVGKSPSLRFSLDQLAQCAPSNVNVLIVGETGTGKEIFARAVHENSLRRNEKFVVVDCAATPESLAESILFGHERGAYTGADRDKDGLIKYAHGGTLFLDEVGELPLSVQKKFLRVLQEHRFLPLGGKTEIESNFRLVAATNRNLEQMVKEKEFREDLLFRIKAFAIELPPLRERLEDIKEIVVYYVTLLCEQYGIEIKGFSADFIHTLCAYDWPGNVRELVNAMEKAILAARYEPILFPKHLPTQIRVKLIQDSLCKDGAYKGGIKEAADVAGAFMTLKDFRETNVARLEKQYLEDLLIFTKRNIRDACRISDLSRSRFYDLLKKHNIRI